MKPISVLRYISEIKIAIIALKIFCIFVDRFNLRILTIIAILIISSSTKAAIYYVDATNGNNINDGLSQEKAWQTITKVNSSIFLQGDQILFKKGEIWREQLTVPSSGLPGIPITFGAYSSGLYPIISGADRFTDFVGGPDVYTKPDVTIEPHIVLWTPEFGQTVILTKNDGAIGSVGINQWDWNSNILYINIGEDPNRGLLEVGQRLRSIHIKNRNHITLDGIKVTGGNESGIGITGGSSYITIKNCTVTQIGNISLAAGIFCNGASRCMIYSNIISYCGNGVLITGYGNVINDNNTISSNKVSYTNKSSIYITDGNSGSAIGPTNTIIEFNDLSYCSQVVDDGAGIHTVYDSVSTTIRYNISYNNGTASSRGAGIMVDHGGEKNKVYYNICFGNTNGGLNIGCKGVAAFNNTFYNNNTQSYNSGEISLFQTQGHSGAIADTIKNNILYASPGKYVIRVSSTSATGHVIDNNCYYPDGSISFNWTGKNYSYTDWEVNSIQDINSILSDPLFTDADDNDFTLTEYSPCIDTGIELELNKDYLGKGLSGDGWDIGANERQFIFSSPKNFRTIK
jgi:hypothetical protein